MSNQASHPLSALTEGEIHLAADLIRTSHPPDTEISFKGITLHEPSKAAYLAFRKGGPTPPRKAWVNYYQTGTSFFHEAIINLETGEMEKHLKVPDGAHGPLDEEEMLAVEKLVIEDETVKAEIKKLQLPEDARILCDPWTWGPDEEDGGSRLFQCYLYASDPHNPKEFDSNHYAFPLSFAPVVDAVTRKVIRIDHLATGSNFDTKPTQPMRDIKPNEYLPEYNDLRTDLKPLVVTQPKGASFTIQGDLIKWQKWELRLTFNYREGMVIHEVSYDNRPLFYRLSLSDMTIPYADPRPPTNRKQVFDLGDVGAGVTANNLKLGCDCLGAIAYRDGLISDSKGRPSWKRNAICIHEQDAGILWKHNNFRTNRGVVVRKRELVLQSIITVGNYEYILAFIFNQAGELEYEMRATGILSTTPIDPGVEVPWGTVVHDGVLAAYHQHILSLRIDPELDGDQENRLVYSEVEAMPRGPNNPLGNGYIGVRKEVNVSGGYDLDPSKNRTYMIENPKKKNRVNGKNIAYKIQVPPFQPIMAPDDTYHYKRADFADHSIYVTKHPSGFSPTHDHELYAGGRYTNQNRQTTGVRKWAGRKDDISNTNIVVWVQFGLQHIPRIEEFPVMPAETIKVHLKPNNFFDRNPAMDVPPSSQAFNQSQQLQISDSCSLHCKTPSSSHL